MIRATLALLAFVALFCTSAAQGHDPLSEDRLKGQLLARYVVQQQILTHIAEQDGLVAAHKILEQSRSIFIDALIGGSQTARRELQKLATEGVVTRKEVADTHSKLGPKIRASKEAGLRYLDLLKRSQTNP